jgi:MATE family multidrug resistance protein
VRVYTDDAAVIAATLPLLAWVAVFHVADAAQTTAAFVLRAWRIATVPLVIYVLAIWGIGLGGGYTIAFDSFGWAPSGLQGAQGFWSAATAGLVIAAGGMCLFLIWMLRQQRAAPAR